MKRVFALVHFWRLGIILPLTIYNAGCSTCCENVSPKHPGEERILSTRIGFLVAARPSI
jgi:hypothetical protein